MKKIILVLAIVLMAFGLKAQTWIHADTALIKNDTIIWNWYHLNFNDSDVPFQMTNLVTLSLSYITPDAIYNRSDIKTRFYLKEGDSLKNPYGTNYFTYTFIKNYIYNNGEDMKRTLTLYHLLNDEDRLINP